MAQVVVAGREALSEVRRLDDHGAVALALSRGYDQLEGNPERSQVRGALEAARDAHEPPAQETAEFFGCRYVDEGARGRSDSGAQIGCHDLGSHGVVRTAGCKARHG